MIAFVARGIEFVGPLCEVARGGHLGDPRVTYVRARDLSPRHFDRVLNVNTDVHVLEARACRYTVLPRAARFLAPRPA